MRLLGNKGEDFAVKYLRKKGYRILKRNYKTPSGEIDIIAETHGTVVFVEVKTRTGNLFGAPLEAVGRTKQRRIMDTALHYLSGLKDQPRVRFDIISVHMKDRSGEIEHLMDAFDAGTAAC